MAPKKDTLLELCTSTIALGNTIAVHTLEYFSIAKAPPQGFKELSIEFLEASRALFPAKAGLSRSSIKYSADVQQELRERFTSTKNAFIILNSMVEKFLSSEKKNGMGKFGKGFRMMFVDTDIEKLRICLSQCRAALSVSALMFASMAGDVKAEEATGIGYTALAAVLDCSDPTKPRSPKTPQESALAELSPDKRPLPAAPTPAAAPAPVLNADTYNPRSTSMRSPTLDEARLDRPQLVGPATSSGSMGSKKTNGSNTYSDRSSMYGIPADNMSEITELTSILSYAQPHDTTAQLQPVGDKMSKEAIRIKVDPSKAQRWTPQRNAVAPPEASRSALATAIQQRDHRMVEQLLDCGVVPDHHFLSEAVINHDLGSVRLLLLFGAEVNAKGKDGSTALYTATGHSFFEAAQLLLKYGADPNMSAGPSGENSFAVSLTSSKSYFAQTYLQHGADANCVMGNGETPFTQAMNKHTPANLVELMLVYEANANNKNSRGETPLFKAINAERLDLVTVLLDHGADPNMPGPKIVLWPAVHQPPMLEILLERGADLRRAPGVLELATSINSRKAIDILLKHGADPNAKKDGIYTPLCSAIRDNREELVELLLASGADPNLHALEHPAFKCVTYHRTHILPRLIAAGTNPNSPKGILEHAVSHNNTSALLLLLEHQVDPNARNATGHTALTTAIREKRPDMIDALLSHGADPGIRGHDWPISMAVKHPSILSKLLPHISTNRINKGAVEMAVVADQLESVQLLLKKGVSVEEKNGGVFSPLTTSIRENRKDIFLYLLDEAGADPNSPGEHLPIIKAIRRHREDDMSYIVHLLEKGADINLMYRGWNAVLQALDNGDTQILKLLAKKGHPDVTARDEQGRTVHEIMQERGLQEEEKILLERRTPSPKVQEALGSLRDMVLFPSLPGQANSSHAHFLKGP